MKKLIAMLLAAVMVLGCSACFAEGAAATTVESADGSFRISMQLPEGTEMLSGDWNEDGKLYQANIKGSDGLYYYMAVAAPEATGENVDDVSYVTYTDEFGYTNTMEAIKSITPRNFFCYSIFRVAPLFAHKVLYDDGFYNSTLAYSLAPSDETTENEYSSPQYRDGLSKAEGVDEDFLNSYAVLQNLPEMTVITDSAAGGFLMMSNDTPHNPMLLQEPGCVPSQIVDNVDYDREHDVRYDAQGNTLDFSIDVMKKSQYCKDRKNWYSLYYIMK